MEKLEKIVKAWDNPEVINRLAGRPRVVGFLARFFGFTIEEAKEALQLRSRVGERVNRPSKGKVLSSIYNNGYRTFTVAKPNGGVRTINDPAPVLKYVQGKILSKFEEIPVSSVATGGKKGKSILDNVKPHIGLSYTICMDVKDAFPSVSGERVRACIIGYLAKQRQFSFPEMTDSEFSDFILAVLALVMKDDELPQGAPTSMLLLNVVMAKVDGEVIKYMHTEAGVERPAYTRYADDLTFSWRCFLSFKEIWQKMGAIRDAVGIEDDEATEARLHNLTQIQGLFGELFQMGKIAKHLKEQKEFRGRISEIKRRLEALRDLSRDIDNMDAFKTLYELIGKIDNELKFDDVEDGMGHVRDGVAGVFIENGWRINSAKTTMHGPGATTHREITGVGVGAEGKLFVPRETIAKFVSFADMCVNRPYELDGRYIGPDGNVDGQAVAYELQGMRAFLVQIVGNDDVGRRYPEFEALYMAARSRYFSSWRLQKPVRPWGHYSRI